MNRRPHWLQPLPPDDAEEALRNILAGWTEGAEEAIAFVRDQEQRGMPENPEDERYSQRKRAEEHLLTAPVLLRLARAGDAWNAARYALWIGLQNGIDQSHPHLYHAKRALRLERPLAEKERQQQKHRAAGGFASRKGPPADALADEVEVMHWRHPALSWTAVCRRVGKRYGLSVRSVQNKVRAARPGLSWSIR
ncbi:MAG: hypothetical protein ABFS34_03030 [Gemmatimonadota bacterium]